MLNEKTIKEFLAETASDSPAPGGGSVAALAGALSAALGTMVCNLTLGKEKFGDVQEEIEDYKSKTLSHMNQLTDLIDEDASAFNDVMKAFKLPKETNEQKKVRSEKIQEGYKKAISTPLSTANISLECLSLLESIAEKGNKNAITDVGTGALMALAAIRGAILNVKINLSSIKDEDYAKETKQEIHDLETKALIKTDAIMKKINKSIM